MPSDPDTGSNTPLFISPQEMRQRLSRSLEEIARRLDHTREQIETLRIDL